MRASLAQDYRSLQQQWQCLARDTCPLQHFSTFLDERVRPVVHPRESSLFVLDFEREASWWRYLRSRPRVTFSTQFGNDAYENSIAVQCLLNEMGLTVYNPNTARDDGICPEGSCAGASNWLRHFEEFGIAKTFHTKGFVLQLVDRGWFRSNDEEMQGNHMQMAKDALLKCVEMHPVPVIEMSYRVSDIPSGEYAVRNLAAVVDIAREQWASGTVNPENICSGLVAERMRNMFPD